MTAEPEGARRPARSTKSGGLTIVVLKDDKIAEIMDSGRKLLETQLRHSLDLAKAGLTQPSLQEGDGCCNCVAC